MPESPPWERFSWHHPDKKSKFLLSWMKQPSSALTEVWSCLKCQRDTTGQVKEIWEQWLRVPSWCNKNDLQFPTSVQILSWISWRQRIWNAPFSTLFHDWDTVLYNAPESVICYMFFGITMVWTIWVTLWNTVTDWRIWLFGCIEDLRRFSGISVISRLGTCEEITNIWNSSDEAGNRTPDLLLRKPRA